MAFISTNIGSIKTLSQRAFKQISLKSPEALTNDGYHDYISQIKKIPLLTEAETFQLFKGIKHEKPLIKKGFPSLKHNECRNKIVTHNLRLVLSVVNSNFRFLGRNIDVIFCGNEGLFKAVDKFDPDKGMKFSTYAVSWIKQAIMRKLIDEFPTIRLPAHIYETLRQIKRICAEQCVTHFGEKNLTKREVNDISGIIQELKIECIDNQPIEAVHNFVELLNTIEYSLRNQYSFEAPFSKETEGEEINLLDILKNENSKDPLEEILLSTGRKELFDIINNVIRDKRNKIMLAERFGLIDGVPKPRRIIADMFGISGESVRVKENASLAKLREHMVKNNITFNDFY